MMRQKSLKRAAFANTFEGLYHVGIMEIFVNCELSGNKQKAFNSLLIYCLLAVCFCRQKKG